MIEFEAKEPAVSDVDPRSDSAGDLPYIVEFWDTERDERRVLARAANASLAHAIFRTACEENPDRSVVLKLGSQIIAERTATRLS